MATKRYNHIPDAPGFPAVDGSDTVAGVNAYQYRNNFDYTKWLPGTTVKLLCVPWDGEDNVVAFDDEKARDKWLDSQESETIELKTAARLLPDGKIALPIPFDYAVHWNYCVVDFPESPVDTFAKSHISRWCFFASAIDAKNPSTTVFNLGVDWWQTYVYRAEFTNAMLERGHAPLAAMPASEYLGNPIANNSLLLAADVNYGSAEISKSGAFFAINDEYIFCFAVPMTLAQITDAAQPGSAGSDSKPTYSDTSDRWGKEYNVNGYEWGFGIKDYSKVETPSTPLANLSDTVYSGVHMLAVQGDPTAFIAALEAYKPEVLANIKGAFALPAKFVALTEFQSVKLGSATYKLAELLPAASALGSFDLTTEAFGYSEEYAEYAKLYTFPYACLEITDTDGKKARVKVENTQGSVDVAAKSAVAFPYVSVTAYIDNVGGQGSCEYQWKLLDGTETTETAPLGAWRELMWKFEIPTIALYANGYTKWQLHNANSAKAATRANALKDYHNNIRAANTDWKNTVAEADTEKSNTYDSASATYNNAVDSASTEQTNANTTASADKANANATASADKSNAYASAAAAYNSVVNAANTQNTNDALDRQLRSTNTVADTSTGATVTNYQNQLTESNVNNDIGYNEYATTVTAVTDAVAGVANAVGTGLSGGGVAGGVACAVSTAVGIAKDIALMVGMNNCNNIKKNNAILNATQIVEIQNDNVEAKSDNTNAALEKQTSNSIAMQKANALLSKNATEGNAERSYSAATGNADRSYSAATGNAERSASTEKSNAKRAKDTTEGIADRSNKTATENAGYSRDATALGLQLELETTQTIASYEAQDRKNDVIFEVCAANGSNEGDVNKWQGLQVQVVTQSDGAIACAASQFARYGYMLNQPWEIKTLNVMPHFSYWKCSDVWVLPGAGIIEGARNAIRTQLTNGVTVWSNPDEIGGVSIWQ